MKLLPLFILLALIAEFLGTVGGFGSSVFFVPFAGYFLDFQSVLGITAVFHLSSNLSKIALFRKGIDWKVIAKIGIPGVVFVILGAYLSKYVTKEEASLGLGIFLVLFAGLMLMFQNLTLKPTIANGAIGGSLSGLFAGVLGTGGAIRGITLAAFNLHKDVFIATSALIDLAIDLSRSVVYFSQGYVHKHDLYLIPILLVVSVLGTWLGKKALEPISEEKFRKLVLILILGIGVVSLGQFVWSLGVVQG